MATFPQSFDVAVNHEYMPSEWSPRKDVAKTYVEKALRYSAELRSMLAMQTEVVKYGPGDKQLLDIVLPTVRNEETPILVFIHGGYWVECSRDMHFFTMKTAWDRGWIGINVGYDQAPDVSLSAIVDEIRGAYVFISQKFPKCQRLVVSGHSAGGHLAAMLLATDWESHYKSVKLVPITKCVPISGILDVRDVVHTCYNKDLKLTEKETEDLSPLLQLDTTLKSVQDFHSEVRAIVAHNDPPVFKRMSKDYIEALKKNCCKASYAEVGDTDHFDIITSLYTEPNFEVTKLIHHDDLARDVDSHAAGEIEFRH